MRLDALSARLLDREGSHTCQQRSKGFLVISLLPLNSTHVRPVVAAREQYRRSGPLPCAVMHQLLLLAYDLTAFYAQLVHEVAGLRCGIVCLAYTLALIVLFVLAQSTYQHGQKQTAMYAVVLLLLLHVQSYALLHAALTVHLHSAPA